MSGVRELRRDDLPEVVALYEEVMRSGTRTAPDGLADYFARTFLDQPWADPEIPSLVYDTDGGAIVGFLGSNPRRMRLDGRPVRLACSSNLVVHPDWRRTGAGALLTRRFLGGPQDLSITDGANDATRQIWTQLRGHTRVGASVAWSRVLRPGAAFPAFLEDRGTGGMLRWFTSAAARPVDEVVRRLPRIASRLVPAEPVGSVETLTTSALLEVAERADSWFRLRPDYDAAYLEWLFTEVEAVVTRGRLVRHLVRDARGNVAGWYLYHLPTAGIAQVLQVAVLGRDAGPVLGHLLWHAHGAGAVAVQGRLEPALVDLLAGPACLLRRTTWAMVHSEDSAILAQLESPRALLTRLEGEWWMGHHTLWR